MGPWPPLPKHHMFSKHIPQHLKQLCQQLCHLHILQKTPRTCSLWPWPTHASSPPRPGAHRLNGQSRLRPSVLAGARNRVLLGIRSPRQCRDRGFAAARVVLCPPHRICRREHEHEPDL